ncbi:GGDEF domain-containing protein [bacterium]|nr:GGDEF domain-containing protein [bacterium]
MVERVYDEIERERFRRHDRTIVSMGYLIALLVAFSENPFGDPLVKVNLYILVTALVLLLITTVLDIFRSLILPISRRIFINTLLYITVITLSIWYSEEQSSLLFLLYYLVFVGALLTLSRRLLLVEIAIITVCILLVTIHHGFSLVQVLQSLVYQLIPFWVIAYVAAEIYQQSEDARHELERLSLTDTLTGLWNMRTFTSFLDREIERSRRYDHVFGLMMLDLDNLKGLNDTYGHLMGSAVIKHTAELIVGNLRKTDLPSRFGGDEYVLLLPETDPDNAIMVAERICRAVRENVFREHGLTMSTTVSIGLSSYPSDGDTADDLITAADKALYLSKKAGKNRVSMYHPDLATMEIVPRARPH